MTLKKPRTREATSKTRRASPVPKKRLRNKKRKGDCEILVCEIGQIEASVTGRPSNLSFATIMNDPDVPTHMKVIMMYSKERHATVAALDGMIKCLGGTVDGQTKVREGTVRLKLENVSAR